MKTDEVISRLQAIVRERGNLRCVTPGFDESAFDDIDTVKIVRIWANVRPGGHCGQHDEMPSDDETAEAAVCINF